MFNKENNRPTRAEISLSALRHNFAIARQAAGSAKIMAVVKAESYGHGLIRV
ncbi:MAG: alanine racemase, partial [Calditrichaeota bacterium]|nr:alanine racemase [Calditrichota bacterium]